MTTLLQGRRYGLRVRWQSRGPASLLAVFSLALRVAASIAIFGVVNAVLLRVLPVSHPQRLVNTLVGNRAAGYNSPAYLTSAERPEGLQPTVRFAPLRPGVTCFISLLCERARVEDELPWNR